MQRRWSFAAIAIAACVALAVAQAPSGGNGAPGAPGAAGAAGATGNTGTTGPICGSTGQVLTNSAGACAGVSTVAAANLPAAASTSIGALYQPFFAALNFRSTSGYVTDDAGYNVETATTANYPATYTMANGATFTAGWETSGVTCANRTTVGDPRVAGICYCSNDGTGKTYRIDLPRTGAYKVRVFFSDQGNNNQVITAILKDGTSAVPGATVTGTTAVVGGIDILSHGWGSSSAGYPTGNIPSGYLGLGLAKQYAFTTTILRLQIGATNIGGSTTLNSITVEGVQ